MPELLALAEKPDRNNGTSVTHRAYSAEWLSPDREPEWDAFVLQHPFGSVYHTSIWKRVIEQAFSHIRGRFLILREVDSGQVRGGLPVYRVGSWLLGNRLASVPFATVCDPLVATLEEWNVLTPELEKECSRTRSKKIEIRAVLRPAQLPPSFEASSLFRNHMLALDTDFETLRSRFDKQSVRQKAEKARRAGVIVEERSDKEGTVISHSLLAMTRRRLTLPPMPYRFFAAMQRNLCPDHMKILLAYQNAKPIACHLVLKFKDQWTSEYSANADGAISGVNQLLYLETIRQACAAGAHSFSYGRTSINNPGLLSYKLRWGTKESILTDYTLQRNPQMESQAVHSAAPSEDSRVYVLCKRLIARSPMSVCKMIGDFCYRHLG